VFSSGCGLYCSAGIYGVKQNEVEWHTSQINKVRSQLNDYVHPVNEIVKPLNMRTVVFNRRIKRLARHEKAFDDKLSAGLVKWFNKVY
jgi:hypothetical protein